MHRARLEFSPGLWLDARRALWLEGPRVLVVADLHLGYAWAHRTSGNLLPVSVAEDTSARLKALTADYAPAELVLLGDIVHAAVPAEALLRDLRRIGELASSMVVRLIAGNHDAKLPALLLKAGLALELRREFRVGPHLLLHGDGADEAIARARLLAARERGGRVIFGHEHPAIQLSDGVTTSARCACFLAGKEALVLPAFSPWSAGTNIRNGTFLSPYARQAQLTHTVAIVANKLLPLNFPARA
ncbi:MAG: uncharacterized protein QOE70_3046 [Chthoniobacter sp.]|jgi:putative SbcD/Mre11-related phosphoesterase|nr:uncharacterized protein [Chthoniobacter sp.]